MPLLQHLPHDILCHVARHCDQQSRAACLTTCRALHSAVSSPGLWSEVTFYDLDHAAVDFMERQRCSIVHVISTCPDDVAWFFEELRDRDIDCIQRLYIAFGPVQRMPMDLLCGIGGQTGLRHLAMRVESLDATSEIFFCRHHQLHCLESIEIMEHTIEAKQLVVWLDGTHSRFEKLNSLVLDVGMSDAMAGLRHMPSIKRAAYSFEMEEGGETYEDMELEGLELDILELDVDCEVDVATLTSELQKCKVGTLVLHVKDEFLDLSPGFGAHVERLLLRMHLTHADIKVDFTSLRAARGLREISLDIAAGWILAQPDMVHNCAHTLYFTRVGSPAEWAAHIGAGGPLQLRLLPTTRVHLAPLD